MKRSCVLVATSIAVAVSAFAARPLALVGADDEMQAVQSDITNRERIRTVAIGAALPTNCSDYAAVVLCGNIPRSVKLEKVPPEVKVVRCEGVSALRLKFIRERKPLYVPDEKGESIPTAEGLEVRAMTERNRKAILALPELDRSLPPCGWDTKPLGAPGPLTYPTELSRKPVFRAPPVRKDGLALLDGSRQAVIVANLKSWWLKRFAEELKYHLDKMGGKPFKVVAKAEATDAVPVIELRAMDGELGRSVIFREGNRLVLGGQSSSGVSHALTYFLEALGCRYLWPGKDGKVVPRRERIVCPDLSLDFVPQLKVRGIRFFPGHIGQTFAKIGVDTNAFNKAYDAAVKDAPGNRGFFEWHGVNDGHNTNGSYSWGHFFGNYYQRFGETHPEWFAMQANGSRKQHLGNRAERPSLCLSNPGLAEQAAKDILARFEKSPNLKSHTICLPDGGYMGHCMCEGCRKLDPVNAVPTVNHTCSPLWRSFPYVALTDRVLTFNNRIAELVTRKMPDRKLSAYVYSYYAAPPVSVKPHPALVLLTVPGWYTGTNRCAALRNVAAWSTFGNELFWRPNALIGWRANVPQNIGRPLFGDLETMKCNNVIGTDFDCFTSQWANRGFETYMLAKAHLNPDRLDYDTLARDYCEHGFGPAAKDVGAYFAALERLGDESAAKGRSADEYLAAFDIDAMAAILGRAKAAAGGDNAILRKIDFLARGLEYARWEKRVSEASVKGDKAALKAAQRGYCEFLRDNAANDAIACHPSRIANAYYTPYMRGAF